MTRVLLPMAQGCEDLETVTVADLLRRAGITVVTAGLEPGTVTGRWGMVMVPDTTLEAVMGEAFDMIVLPGGLPGTERLEQDPRIRALLQRQAEGHRYLAAICAAPRVLAQAGLLHGREATAYPGILEKFPGHGARLSGEVVVRDGSLITSRGPGTAMDFALELIEVLVGQDKRMVVEQALQRPQDRG